MAESLLDLSDVVVCHGDKIALKIPHLKVNAGEVLGLLGPNGAGKTTLLRVMGLLQTPSTGSVEFDGVPVSPANSLAIRRRTAMVFQEPLLLNSTVYQNAALGLKLRGLRRGEIADRLGPWLERLGIAQLAARSARTLSGGEAQRTSLARALVLEPELLLLDEPFAAMDPSSREQLLRDFQRIVKEAGVTTVFVTHDRTEAFALADRVGILADGRMIQLSAREEVFRRPVSQSVAEIVGVENRLSGTVRQNDGLESVIAIGGTIIRLQSQFPRGTKVVVFVRAEDVTLVPVQCQTSDRVSFRGKVVEVSPGVSRHRIAIDCAGLTLIALVERKDGRAVSPGDEITALFSAAAIHVIAAEEDR
ncbi:MAG: ABC transporter ATP-binding protein [Candidatus Binatia bacterium]